MNDEYVSRLAVIAGVSWVAVIVVMLLGWTVVFVDPERWMVGIMLAETGCVASACAAVFSIRRYAVRICRLIRHLNGLENDDGPTVRSLR